jgi:hypothetical protein
MSIEQMTIVKVEDLPQDRPIKVVPANKEIAVDALVVSVLNEGKTPTLDIVRRIPGREMVEGFLLTQGGLPVLRDNGQRIYAGGNNSYAFPKSKLYETYKQALASKNMW